MGLASPPSSPHKPSPHSPFISDPRRWERLEEHFVFTIARNPYVRVLSAYLDKIHGSRDQKVWSRFAARHGLGEQELTFGDFLRIVAETPDDQMDPHWRPQRANLIPSVVPYDFIGSLENFDADLAHILTCIFPDRAVPIRDHKPHRTGAAERLAEFYGPEELASGAGDLRTRLHRARLRPGPRQSHASQPDRPAGPEYHQVLGPGLPADGRAQFRRRRARVRRPEATDCGSRDRGAAPALPLRTRRHG